MLDYYVKNDVPWEAIISEEELVSNRRANSDLVLSTLKAIELDEEICKMKVDEADNGWTTEPRPLDASDLDEFNLARTICVLEWRDHLQRERERVRMVDHSTESEITDATGAERQKMHSDTLETLVWLISFLLHFGVMPFLFKADVESAFRKRPVKPGHFQFAAGFSCFPCKT